MAKSRKNKASGTRDKSKAKHATKAVKVPKVKVAPEIKKKANKKPSHVEFLKTIESSVAVISQFTTLQDYKQHISSICNKAIAYPESHLKQVFSLYDAVNLKGGGTEALKQHVSTLALISMVAVASHLIPRISTEFITNTNDDQIGEDDTDVQVSKAVQKHKGQVERERLISTHTVHLRDSLVHVIKHGISRQPQLMLPLAAELLSADNRACESLIQICVEHGTMTRHAEAAGKCLDAVEMLLKHGSLGDIVKTIKVIFKQKRFTAPIAKLINQVSFLKKKHESNLLDLAMKPSEKQKSLNHLVEDALQAIIAKYITTVEKDDDNSQLLEACLYGLGKFGLLVNAQVQAELLQRLRQFSRRDGIPPMAMLYAINSISYLMKHTQMADVSPLFERILTLMPCITPQLYHGDLYLAEGTSIAFSKPCLAGEYLKCLENLSALISKNNAASIGSAGGAGSCTADLQLLARVVLALVAQSLVVDSNVALSLLKVAGTLTSRVPKLKGLLDEEGMIISVISTSQTCFWELQLLSAHVAPYIQETLADVSGASNYGATSKKPHVFKSQFSRDFMYVGIDVHEILHVAEDSIMDSFFKSI